MCSSESPTVDNKTCLRMSIITYFIHICCRNRLFCMRFNVFSYKPHSGNCIKSGRCKVHKAKIRVTPRKEDTIVIKHVRNWAQTSRVVSVKSSAAWRSSLWLQRLEIISPLVCQERMPFLGSAMICIWIRTEDEWAVNCSLN